MSNSVYHVNTDSMQTTLTGKFVSVLMLFLCSSLLQCGARILSAGGKSLGEAGEQRGDEVQGAECRLKTEVKERRSREVGVGMMREERHLAAVLGPGRAEGNVPWSRDTEYPQ